MKRSGVPFESVTSFMNLCEAARRAAKGHRDSIAAAKFMCRMESEVLALRRELTRGSYEPGAFTQFIVTDPKVREIAAAPFRDRVVHHALCAAMEPVLEGFAIDDSYACRKGKGTHAALARAKRWCGSFPWCLKLDVERFFQSVDHGVLERQLAGKFKDRRLLALAGKLIAHVPAGSAAGHGLPVGNLTSQHFANFHLGELDHFVKERLGVHAYLRYMDDMLFFWSDKRVLAAWRQDVEQWLYDHLHLRLNEKQTLLAPTWTGIPFLGFRLYPRLVRLQRRSAVRFGRKLQRAVEAFGDKAGDPGKAMRSTESLVGHTRWAATAGFRRGILKRLTGGKEWE